MNADGSGFTQLTDPKDTALDPTLSPDGNEIAFVREAYGWTKVIVMDIHGKEERVVVGSSDVHRDPAWSQDGSKIAYASSHKGRNSDISFKDLDTKPITQLTNGLDEPSDSTEDRHPTWSPDGQKIAFIAFDGPGAGKIEFMFSDGSSRETRGYGNNPSWSPDGTRIAYDNGGSIFVTSPAGDTGRN